MTKVELLAKALNGSVIEDHGYRGIIWVEERNEHIRYHAAHGVHVVVRMMKTWRVVRPVLAPDEVTAFLVESKVLPKIEPQEQPLEQIAKLLQGSVVKKFNAGGGIIKADGLYVRFSNVSGLDVVELVVTKWRVIEHLFDRRETLKALADSPNSIVERLSARSGAIA